MKINTRLFRVSQCVMYGSFFTVLTCVFIVFGLEGRIPIVYLVIGHALIMFGATGVKIGYIIRLEAIKQVQEAQRLDYL